MLEQYAEGISRIARPYIHVMPELAAWKQRTMLTAYYTNVAVRLAKELIPEAIRQERERQKEKPELGRIAEEVDRPSIDPGVVEAAVRLGEKAAFAKSANYRVDIDHSETGRDVIYAATQGDISSEMYRKGYKWWPESEVKKLGKWENVKEEGKYPYKQKVFEFRDGSDATVRIYSSRDLREWGPNLEMFAPKRANKFAVQEAERAIKSGKLEKDIMRGMQKLMKAGAKDYVKSKGKKSKD